MTRLAGSSAVVHASKTFDEAAKSMSKNSKESKAPTSIAEFSRSWGVSPKTVSTWRELVYQGFDILLPVSGLLPEWGLRLLTITAKHVSSKAGSYTAETGELRRLKGSEFIAKILRLRAEGHFQEFQPLQISQGFQMLPTSENLME